MNDTKWNELRSAMMNEMPFQPAFIVKYVMDDTGPDEALLEKDIFGDWYYGLSLDRVCFNAFFAIEWIKIRPSYKDVTDGKSADASEQLEFLLQKYNVPYEKSNGLYTIFGYK